MLEIYLRARAKSCYDGCAMRVFSVTCSGCNYKDDNFRDEGRVPAHRSRNCKSTRTKCNSGHGICLHSVLAFATQRTSVQFSPMPLAFACSKVKVNVERLIVNTSL